MRRLPGDGRSAGQWLRCPYKEGARPIRKVPTLTLRAAPSPCTPALAQHRIAALCSLTGCLPFQLPRPLRAGPSQQPRGDRRGVARPSRDGGYRRARQSARP